MNFVCLVFELGDKTLTLSPMENLMVKCNLKGDCRDRLLLGFSSLLRKLLTTAGMYLFFSGKHSLLNEIHTQSP